MAQSKTIKIFLASSITEFKNERLFLGNYIANTVRPIFKNDDVDVELIKCEDKPKGNKGNSSQEEIDNLLRDCGISIFLFKKQAGEKTIHEFDVARDLQKTPPPHEIYVYMFTISEKKKSGELIDFQKRLKEEEFYWVDCKSVHELISDFFPALLEFERQLFGKKAAPIVEQESETEKAGEARVAEYMSNEKRQTQLRKMIHQDIDDLLQQAKSVMEDKSDTIAARIFKAKELYKKADLWATKTDYDKEKYSHLLFDYAGILYEYGLYRDSEAVYLRQMPLAEELYGTEHEDTTISYNNIGLVYNAQGDYSKALEYLFKALDVREKKLGADHLDTATSYNNIGLVYHNQGDYPKALEYYFKALEIREKELGTDHPDTANSYNNIGLVYHAQSDYPKALEYYFKALEIYEKVLSKEHFFTATSYNNIGGVYDAQGDYSKALEYYFMALEIYEKKLGGKHSFTATSYNNIGGMYHVQGDYPKALEFYFKALEIRERVLGTYHPDTATSYNNIGALYYTMNECDKALEYLNKALEINKTILGPKHPNTQTVQRWINKVHAAMGKG